MDESRVIRDYFTRGYPERGDVVVGVGDDGAVTRLGADEELVTVTDTIVEGTHFPASLAADAVAHRALAVNLSDLAAMGAEPRWFTLSLAMPEAGHDWLQSFAGGLARLAGRFEVALVGGDTVRGPLAVTVSAFGAVPAGAAVRRSGAATGDAIYVTGHLGDAGWTWQSLASGTQVDRDDPLMQRFVFPEPRVREGLALRALATSMIDVSDGLHVDLGRLMAAGQRGAAVNADRVPVSAELVARAGEQRACELALTGGDDYELCFTVAKSSEAELARQAVDWRCPVTRIGAVVARPGVAWQRAGRDFLVPDAGFRHF